MTPMQIFQVKKQQKSKNQAIEREIKETGFLSRKATIRASIKTVPRKYRAEVNSRIKATEFKDKYMIEKGLIGKEGKIEKVVKEIEMIEDYALEKIAQTRANQKKKKQGILDQIKENQRNDMKERLERRFNEAQASS